MEKYMERERKESGNGENQVNQNHNHGSRNSQHHHHVVNESRDSVRELDRMAAAATNGDGDMATVPSMMNDVNEVINFNNNYSHINHHNNNNHNHNIHNNNNTLIDSEDIDRDHMGDNYRGNGGGSGSGGGCDDDDYDKYGDEYDLCDRAECALYSKYVQPSMNTSFLHNIRYYPVSKSRLLSTFQKQSSISQQQQQQQHDEHGCCSSSLDEIVAQCAHLDQYKRNGSFYQWWWRYKREMNDNQLDVTTLDQCLRDPQYYHQGDYGDDDHHDCTDCNRKDHHDCYQMSDESRCQEGLVRFDLSTKPFRIRSSLRTTGLELHFNYSYFFGKSITPLTPLIRWDVDSDVKLTFENTKLENIHFVCTGTSMLHIVNCDVINCVIVGRHKSKLIIANNRIRYTNHHTVTPDRFCIHVEHQCTADIDCNQFHFNWNRRDMTAIRILVPFELGFGIHCNITNNLFVGCYQGIECITDKRTLAGISEAQLVPHNFHHSVSINYNTFKLVELYSIVVSVMFLEAKILSNNITDCMRPSNFPNKASGIKLSHGSRCTVAHNHIESEPSCTFNGIETSGMDTTCFILYNYISKCTNGVYCTEGCRPEISDNELLENEINILIEKSALAHVRHNTIKFSIGVSIREQGRAYINLNKFDDCKMAIKLIDAESMAIVSQNTIWEGSIGVDVGRHSCCLICQNQIDSCGDIGARISNYGQAYIHNNVISNCKTMAILFTMECSNNHGEILPVTPYEPPLFSSLESLHNVFQSSTPFDEHANWSESKVSLVQDNKIKNNVRGIKVENYGVHVLSNDIYRNSQGNLYVEFTISCTPLLALEQHVVIFESNRIFGDGKYGISVFANTPAEVNVIIHHNTITGGDFGVGIFGYQHKVDSWQEEPTIVVEHNDISHAKVNGVMLQDNSCGSVEHNTIRNCSDGVLVIAGCYCILKHNTISNNQKHGIRVVHASSALEVEKNVLAANMVNLCVNNTETTLLSGSKLNTTVISGNVIKDATVDNMYIALDRRYGQVPHLPLLRIVGNEISDAKRYGIFIHNCSDDILISRNTIQANETANLCVPFDSKKFNLSICDNHIYGTKCIEVGAVAPIEPHFRNNHVAVAVPRSSAPASSRSPGPSIFVGKRDKVLEKMERRLAKKNTISFVPVDEDCNRNNEGSGSNNEAQQQQQQTLAQ